MLVVGMLIGMVPKLRAESGLASIRTACESVRHV